MEETKELELKDEIVKVESEVDAIVVDSKEAFEYASDVVISIDGMVKKIKEFWKEPKEKAYQAHKAISAKESEMLKPLEDRRKALKSNISAYLTEQERLRLEEQRKLDAERRAKEAELQKKADEERAKAIAENKPVPVVDTYVPQVIAMPEVQKTTKMEAGTVSGKKDIEITIVDILALVKAIADGKAPISIVDISASKLKAFVKLQQLKQLDGCEIREVVTAAFRSKSA